MKIFEMNYIYWFLLVIKIRSMSSIESVIKSLELKTNQILNRLNQLQTENKSLKNDLITIKQTLNEKIISLKEKESELESLKIANSMLGDNEIKRVSKLKINALIRDINDCISLDLLFCVFSDCFKAGAGGIGGTAGRCIAGRAGAVP